MRVALTGSSGTGKTTLAKFIAKEHGLELNPVGSRSVASAMGYASPYDVDKAGRRAEFQARLIEEKVKWETEHAMFVTDRTTLDNLVYTMLHDVHSIDHAYLRKAVDGLAQYSHIIYCPVDAFCNVDDDPARVQSLTYQVLFDTALWGLLDRMVPTHQLQSFMVLDSVDPDERKHDVAQFLRT